MLSANTKCRYILSGDEIIITFCILPHIWRHVIQAGSISRYGYYGRRVTTKFYRNWIKIELLQNPSLFDIDPTRDKFNTAISIIKSSNNKTFKISFW